MGKWVEIGEELPVKDQNGNRPDIDDEGNDREVEFVSYKPLEGIEVDINDMSSVGDRRWLDAMLDGLASRRSVLSSTAAMDLEDGFTQAVERFVDGARHKDGTRELSKKEAVGFLVEQCEHEDRIAVLFTLKRNSGLARSKKKSWNCRFGLPTSSRSKD
jgi:hypothetical protein